jgi:ribosomal protein S18 acetylase RimI-like enzyme
VDGLSVRPMTVEEFGLFRAALISDYAADHVRAGNWAADQSQELAAGQIDGLLPEGPETPGMLVLTALSAAGDAVGHLWVGLERAEAGGGAWIFDIEVAAEQRGQGYGRALLAAAERETARHGGQALGLNVFGDNTVARSLYESSGYEIKTLQMRKELGG